MNKKNNKNANQLDINILPAHVSKKKLEEFKNLNDVQLIKRYREHNDIDARNYLVVRYMDLYFKLAHQYSKSIPFDEAVQLCALQCMHVIDSFDFDRKVTSLSTILYVALPHRILMSIRNSQKHANNVSFNEKPDEMDEDYAEYIDTISFDKDVNIDHLYSADNINALQSAINTLNKDSTEYKAISLYYGLADGKVYSQQDIAKKLNLTQSAVSRALTSCHRRLREILESRGYSAEIML